MALSLPKIATLQHTERFAKARSIAQQPLPKIRHGMSMHTPLQKIQPEQYTTDNQEPLEVKHDGNVTVYTYQDAPKKLQQLVGTLIIPDDYFGAYNYVAASQVLIVDVQEKTTNNTVHITVPQGTKIYRLFVNAQQQSEVLVTITSDHDKHRLHSACIEVIVHDDAHATVCTRALTGNGIADIRRAAQVHTDARMTWFDVSLANDLSLSTTKNILKGNNAQAQTYNAVYLSDEQRTDHYTVTHHHGTHTNSDLQVKAISAKQAVVLDRGLVKIHETGQHSDGYQQADMLIVDETATANALPQLEINNNDVRCSHGATMAKIDDDQLFYMRARGINTKQARHLVLQGFVTPIIDLCPYQPWKQEIQQAVEHKSVGDR